MNDSFILEFSDPWTDCRNMTMLSLLQEKPVGVGLLFFFCKGCEKHKVFAFSLSVGKLLKACHFISDQHPLCACASFEPRATSY